MPPPSKLSEQLDMAERILARNLVWISAADSKATLIFTIDAAMLAVVAALVPGATTWRVIPAVVASLASLAIMGSVGCLAAALFPRLDGPKNSIVFFGTAINLGETEFITRIREGITEKLVTDVATQAYRNAEIAAAKFRHVKHAQVLLFGAAIPWLVAVALLYAARK